MAAQEGSPATRQLLIVDDDQEFAESIADILIPAGYEPIVADRPETAAIALKRYNPPIAIIDVRLGGTSGVEFLAKLKHERPDLIGIMMTAHADTQTAITALRRGAYDYFDKSCDPDELRAVLDRAFERHNLEVENRAAYDTLRVAKESAEAAKAEANQAAEKMKAAADDAKAKAEAALKKGEEQVNQIKADAAAKISGDKAAADKAAADAKAAADKAKADAKAADQK